MMYLDASATTPVRRDVLEAMWPYLTGEFANPSSQHAPGKRAAAALADARSLVAHLLGTRSSEIIFTSGGTEANNLAIKGIALANPRGRHIVTSAIEHEAVFGPCDFLERHHGFSITKVPVDATGLVHREAFANALRDDTTLCTVMLANNEIGTVEPIAELARRARARGVPFHTDAVQGGGALDVRPGVLEVDSLSLSGHKLGAPKGSGILYASRRVALEPLLHGGGQERGRRSGTENVAAAVGFARALALTVDDLADHAAKLSATRDRLIAGVLRSVPGARLTGHATQRLPGHASFCFTGVSGEAMLLQLEERGVVCSSGSACAAGRDEASPVLLALGVSEEVARTAVRFSFADPLTSDELGGLLSAITAAHEAVMGGRKTTAAPAGANAI